jgi:hypothetical protein
VATIQVSNGARAATLAPPPLTIQVVDAAGRVYDRDVEAEERLGLEGDLDGPLAPGAYREVRVAFALAGAPADSRLRVRLARPAARLVEAALVGDADGLFHAPVYHALDA